MQCSRTELYSKLSDFGNPNRARIGILNGLLGQPEEYLEKALHPNAVYENIVRHYGGISVHSLRATAATNALDHEADMAKVPEWLGHANISTTRLYDRRKSRPEDSRTFQVWQEAVCA